MPFPRLTWAGLLIATLGWGFLLSFPLIAPAAPIDAAQAGHFRNPSHFIPLLGENAIVTGFALAVLGALEKVLDLLGRQLVSGQQLRPLPKAVGPLPVSPTSTIRTPQTSSTMLMPQRAAGEVVTRGALNGRDYVLFRDGSVVVETLLGPRRFGSITEAQEFIGAS
jgi:hypothetical protein